MKLLRSDSTVQMLDDAIQAVICPLEACEECCILESEITFDCFDAHQVALHKLKGLLCVCSQCLHKEIYLRTGAAQDLGVMVSFSMPRVRTRNYHIRLPAQR